VRLALVTQQPLAQFGLDPSTDEVIATALDVWAELRAESEAARRG
jgi:hypothetical protein